MGYLSYGIALVPIGLYWILIGYLYQRRHPMLINAAQDTLLLGLGAVGLAAIGPMDLFFPLAAYSLLGAWTWFFLLCLYGFVVLFLALNRRPQWTVYGMSSTAFRGLLERSLDEDQVEHAWHGSIVVSPELGIKAMVEPANATDRAAQLTRCGRDQSLAGWNRIEKKVAAKLLDEPSAGGGVPWIVAGVLTIVVSMVLFWMNMDNLLQAWEQL